MVKSLNLATETRLFNNFNQNAPQIKAQLKNIEHLGLSQIERLMYDISTKIDTSNPANLKILQAVMSELKSGKRLNEIPMIKELFATNSAAIKEVPEGSFMKAGVWKRIATVVAGPFFNFILAFIFSLIICSFFFQTIKS